MINSLDEKKDQLNLLLEYKDNIKSSIEQIRNIIQQSFPEEYDIAYQHWIPQILTALDKYEKWLPRGDQTMQKTIDRLNDKFTDKSGQTLKRFL